MRRCHAILCIALVGSIRFAAHVAAQSSGEPDSAGAQVRQPLDEETQRAVAEYLRLSRGFRDYDFVGGQRSWEGSAWVERHGKADALIRTVEQFGRALGRLDELACFPVELGTDDRRHAVALGLGGLLVIATRDPPALARVRELPRERIETMAAELTREAQRMIVMIDGEAAKQAGLVPGDPGWRDPWSGQEDQRGQLEALLCGAAIVGRDASLMPLYRRARKAGDDDRSPWDRSEPIRHAFFPALVMAEADACWTVLADIVESTPAKENDRAWLTQSLRSARGGNRRLLDAIARSVGDSSAHDLWNCLCRQAVIEYRKSGSRTGLDPLKHALERPRRNDDDPEERTNRSIAAQALFGLYDLAEPALAREFAPPIAYALESDVHTMGVYQHAPLLGAFPRFVERDENGTAVIAMVIRQPLLVAARARPDANYSLLKLIGAYGCYANEPDLLAYVREQLTKAPLAAPALAAILGVPAIAEIDAIDPASCELVGRWKEAQAPQAQSRDSNARRLGELETREGTLMAKIAEFEAATSALDASGELNDARRLEREQGAAALQAELGRTQKEMHDAAFGQEVEAKMDAARFDFAAIRPEARRVADIVSKLRSIDPAEFRAGLRLAAEHRQAMRRVPEINYGQWYVPDMLEAYRAAPTRFGDHGAEIQAAILEVAATYGTLALRELIDAERVNAAALPPEHPVRKLFDEGSLRSLPPLLDIW